MTELVALFSALLKTYPNLMRQLNDETSTDLTRMIVQTHAELSRGNRIAAPESFSSCVKQDVPQEDWQLAIRCMRVWGPTSEMDFEFTADEEVERITIELLWMSALITELQQRELDEPPIQQPAFDPVGPVQ